MTVGAGEYEVVAEVERRLDPILLLPRCSRIKPRCKFIRPGTIGREEEDEET